MQPRNRILESHPRLEAATCLCYRVLRDEYGRLMETLDARGRDQARNAPPAR